ncbi:MAG: hydroxyacid dehydrogenase, partial [Armatimonadota bacterium]
MAKILVSDPIAAEGIKILEQCGEVDVKTGLSKEELISIIGEYDALAVRSETKVTADVIEAAKKLKIIGRAGVGVDNIDVPTATRHGILVVNSPGGNTIAAAELTMALMLAMARNIPAAVVSLKNGEWKRKQFTGVELYKKVLGVIGLGKIGREVARRALGFEMEVLAYDPFQSAETAARAGIRLVELDELISKSDFIT